jgi:MFS family permease
VNPYEKAVELARARIPWRPIAAVGAIATLFTAMQGLSYPLLAVILDRRGAPAAFIGVNTAMMPLGMILASPFAAPLLQRLGGRLLATICILGAVTALLLIGAITNPWAWMPLRLLLGFSLAFLFVVSDTWMIELATGHARGRVLGLYSMLQSVGFAIGPGLLLLVGTQGWAPFLLGALCGLLSLIPLLTVRGELPRHAVEGDRPMSTLAFVSTAPLLLAGIAASALADQVAMSMLPIFTLRHGLTVDGSNLTLVVMIAGTIGFQLPIGWLADHMPGRALYLSCVVWTAATAALLPIAVRAPLTLWLLVFLWGGGYFAIYTLSLVRLGERFKGSALAAGNAAFAAMWGLGGVVGTPLAGGAMQLLGPIGLPIVVAGIFTLLAAAILLSSRW